MLHMSTASTSHSRSLRPSALARWRSASSRATMTRLGFSRTSLSACTISSHSCACGVLPCSWSSFPRACVSTAWRRSLSSSEISTRACASKAQNSASTSWSRLARCSAPCAICNAITGSSMVAASIVFQGCGCADTMPMTSSKANAASPCRHRTTNMLIASSRRRRTVTCARQADAIYADVAACWLLRHFKHSHGWMAMESSEISGQTPIPI